MLFSCIFIHLKVGFGSIKRFTLSDYLHPDKALWPPEQPPKLALYVYPDHQKNMCPKCCKHFCLADPTKEKCFNQLKCCTLLKDLILMCYLIKFSLNLLYITQSLLNVIYLSSKISSSCTL